MIVHTASMSLCITFPAGSQWVAHSTLLTCSCSCSGNSQQRECPMVYQFLHFFQIFCNFSPTQNIYLDQITSLSLSLSLSR